MTTLSRKGFIALAGASAGAVALGCGGDDDEERAREARTEADLAIVQFLLRVERTTTAFWEQVVQRNTLTDVGANDLATQVARNERAHVDLLLRYERRLGNTASDVPTTDFAGAFAAGPSEVLRTGAQMANLAASAYLGQANRIQDRNLLASVLGIHSVEGRQAAAINDEAGVDGEVFPSGAFAEPVSMSQIRSRLERLAA